MAHRMWLRSLTVVIFAVGFLRTGVGQTTQHEIAIEPPQLDRPLIFDSSTRGSGGTKISGPKFRVVPLLGFSYPYHDGSAPEDNPFSGRPGHKAELYALGILPANCRWRLSNAQGYREHDGTRNGAEKCEQKEHVGSHAGPLF